VERGRVAVDADVAAAAVGAWGQRAMRCAWPREATSRGRQARERSAAARESERRAETSILLGASFGGFRVYIRRISKLTGGTSLQVESGEVRTAAGGEF
jgi:hypothetical protein